MLHVGLVHTILYVSDRERSTGFYEKILGRKADLSVPGMTEFNLSESIRLGLMPETGIAKILGDRTPHPSLGTGIPRCELYLYVSDIELASSNAVAAGATPVSGIASRDWGDRACYFADPDGHIIAFAVKENEK